MSEWVDDAKMRYRLDDDSGETMILVDDTLYVMDLDLDQCSYTDGHGVQPSLICTCVIFERTVVTQC